MTATETGLYLAFATLVVERVASHIREGSHLDATVRKIMGSLVADLQAEHAECKKRLSRLESILVDITDDTSPAE